MKIKTFNKLCNALYNGVLWFLILSILFVIFTVGIYRMYIDEENKYLLNDYLKKEVEK